jgi:O-succinylbenzoate synthase
MITWIFNYRRYRLPFRAVVRTGRGEWREREGVVVRLEDAGGRVGYGEAATMAWFGTETADEVEAVCVAWGSRVDESQMRALPARLGCLRHALAAATVPSSRFEPRAAHLAMAGLLPAGRAALAAAVPKAEAGFRVFKWKVGVGEIDEEMGLFDELCSAVPEGSKFRLDANGAWDGRQAERWFKLCAERPVEWIEQPAFVPSDGTSAGGALRQQADDLLMGLAEDYPTPVALDESLVGEGDVDRWLAAGWPGVYVVKPSLFGDVAGVLSRLAKAKAAVCFSSAFETAIGARSALQSAFAWPGEARALGFGAWPLFEDARCNGPSATPFLRWTDVERLNPEAVWTALS